MRVFPHDLRTPRPRHAVVLLGGIEAVLLVVTGFANSVNGFVLMVVLVCGVALLFMLSGAVCSRQHQYDVHGCFRANVGERECACGAVSLC